MNFVVDHLIERTRLVQILELLLSLYHQEQNQSASQSDPKSDSDSDENQIPTIHTLAHVQGRIAGQAETSRIVSTFLSHSVNTIKDLNLSFSSLLATRFLPTQFDGPTIVVTEGRLLAWASRLKSPAVVYCCGDSWMTEERFLGRGYLGRLRKLLIQPSGHINYLFSHSDLPDRLGLEGTKIIPAPVFIPKKIVEESSTGLNRRSRDTRTILIIQNQSMTAGDQKLLEVGRSHFSSPYELCGIDGLVVDKEYQGKSIERLQVQTLNDLPDLFQSIDLIIDLKSNYQLEELTAIGILYDIPCLLSNAYHGLPTGEIFTSKRREILRLNGRDFKQRIKNILKNII